MAQKDSGKLQRRLDEWSRAIFLDENGRPKSSTFLYAFCMAVLYILVYFGAYALWYRLLNRHESMVSGNWLLNVLEVYLFPALVGSIPCVALMYAFKKKKEIPMVGFLIMTAMHIIVCIAFVFMCDWPDIWELYHPFLQMMGYQGFCCILCGALPAYLIFRKWKYEQALKKLAQYERQKSRPSYYNS